MSRRSPVKLVCKQPWKPYGDDMKVCRWTCPRGGGTVQFRSRKRPSWYAILHPSTKQKGWQLTTFDELGPMGDVIRSSCEEALYDAGINESWKLEEVPPSQLQGARSRRRRRR